MHLMYMVIIYHALVLEFCEDTKSKDRPQVACLVPPKSFSLLYFYRPFKWFSVSPCPYTENPHGKVNVANKITLSSYIKGNTCL